jgi:tetratricopeptide (TPR) repeat protein
MTMILNKPIITTFLSLCLIVPSTLAAQSSQSDLKSTLQNANTAYDSGNWSSAKTLYQKALDTAEDGSELQAEAALNLSHLLWEQGEYIQASEFAEKALNIAEKRNLKEGLGRLLLTVGHIEASRGKLLEAKDTLRICEKLSKKQGDKVFAALCRLNKRTVRQLLGEEVAPTESFQKDLETIRAHGSPLAAGVALAKTADLHQEANNDELAEKLLKDAHKNFEKAESTPSLLKNRLRLARLYQKQGEFEKMRSQLQGTLERFEKMGVNPSLVHALELKALDFEELGQSGKAESYFKRSLSAAEKTDSPQLLAKARLNLCEFYARQRNLKAAKPVCSKALDGFETAKMPSLVARTHAQLAHLAHRKQKLEEARKHYQEAVSAIQSYAKSSLPAFAREMANLCQVEMLLTTQESHKQCKKALKVLANHPNPPKSMRASTHYAVGITAKRTGKTDEATKHLRKAARLAHGQQPADRDLASDAYLRLGAILAKNKKTYPDAKKAFISGLDVVRHAENPDKLKSARREILKQKGQLELNMKEWKQGLQTLETLSEEVDTNPKLKAWTFNSIGKAHLRLDREDAAESALQVALPLAKQVGDEDLVKQIESNLEQFQ